MFSLKPLKKLYKKVISGVAVCALIFSAQAIVPAATYAVDDGASAACMALKEFDPTIDCTTGGSANDVAKKPLTAVVNLLTFVVGAITVIMIIFGAFKFITSGGDSEATKKARTTVLYALVGLALVISAQVIVRVAFSTAKDIGTGGTTVPPTTELDKEVPVE